MTIAAISTANAPGGIGVVRISGEQAREIAGRVFVSASGKKLSEMKGYTATFGYATGKNGEKLDDVVALVFAAPRSYTGEDVVELSCHGGMYVTRRLLSAVLDAGARPAQAGEFTKRAFLNGKMDLAQAESVMQVISASGEQAARVAVAGGEGNLSRKIGVLRDEIKDMAAHLAAWADFPDEDIPQVEGESLMAQLSGFLPKLDALLNGFEKTKIYTQGVDTVIVGRVNAGKSTLMNLLAGRERSIVTDIEGTTRDVVEENVFIAGIPIRLSDTAGIRETEDVVEKLGVQNSLGRMKTAQLVFVMFDASQKLDEQDMEIIKSAEGKNAIALVNKTDLQMKLDIDVLKKHFEHVVFISAKEEKGIDDLSNAVETVLNTADYDGADETLFTERQNRDVQTARDSISEALEALQSRMTLDAVTVCVEDALEALYRLTGERVSDEIVDEVFEKFCVGK